MRAILRISLALALAIITSLVLFSCAEIGLFGSKTQTFTTRESLELKPPRPDILDVAAEVGKSMGYDISSSDKRAGTIGLSSSTSFLTEVLIGKINQSDLTIMLGNNGASLDINIMVMGNFGAGGQEAAMTILNDFITRLSQKIGQQLEFKKLRPEEVGKFTPAIAPIPATPSFQKDILYPPSTEFDKAFESALRAARDLGLNIETSDAKSGFFGASKMGPSPMEGNLQFRFFVDKYKSIINVKVQQFPSRFPASKDDLEKMINSFQIALQKYL